MKKTEQDVIAAIKELTPAVNKNKVNLNANLADLDVDRIALKFALECGIGIVISDKALDQFQTVEDVVEFYFGQ